MEFTSLSTKPKTQVSLPVAGKEIDVSYDENSISVDENLNTQVLKLLSSGYSYLLNIIDRKSMLGMKNILKLKRTGRHQTAGLDMDINVEQIEQSLNSGDPYQMDLQQSLLIHEIVHHLVTEEHFPMFIEMIYMLEKGHIERFQNIKQLFLAKKLSKPYQDGLLQIAAWLGYANIETILDNFPLLNPANLKEIFKRKYKELCEQDPEISVQIEDTRQKLRNAA